MATPINPYQLSLYLPVATAALGREQRPHWQLSQRLLQLIGLLGLALTLELAGGTARTIALTLYDAGLILHGVGLIRPRRRSLAALIFTLALLYQLFLLMALLPEGTGPLNLTAKLLALAIALGFLLHVLATTAGSPSAPLYNGAGRPWARSLTGSVGAAAPCCWASACSSF